ncbi:MAG TPA: response regulator [Rhizobiales bacterium]|nr:response regulator [Hyphomicrobiales bacterium]
MAIVLCIEDEAPLREIIVEELEDEGYDVLEAGNGREGLEMILRHHPDIVVSDITMPQMNGHELLLELRQNHPKFAELPFLFLSALADKSQVIEGLELGADDYLTKPIDYDMLLAKVKAGLRQSERVAEKQQRDQVKLFKALTNDASEAEAPLPKMSPRYVALVGASDKGLFDIQRLLEELGHKVSVFTSGSAYLRKVRTDGLKAHLTMLWVQTDDMQGPMIVRTTQNRYGAYVLVIPDTLSENMHNVRPNGVDEVIGLPMSEDELVRKIAQWTRQDLELSATG